jgi:hypothetical protein
VGTRMVLVLPEGRENLGTPSLPSLEYIRENCRHLKSGI